MSAARPAPGAALMALADLPDPGAVALSFADGEARFGLIVTRRGAAVAAFEDRCPHARFPLSRFDGAVLVAEGRFVVCAAHGASFDLLDGACAGGPGPGAGLTPLPVVVDAQGVVRMGAARG